MQQATLLDIFTATGGATSWHSAYPYPMPVTYRWGNLTSEAGLPAHCTWRGVYCCLPAASLPAPFSAPAGNVIDPTQPLPYPATVPPACSTAYGVAALLFGYTNLTGILPDLAGLGSSLEVPPCPLRAMQAAQRRLRDRGGAAQVLDLSGVPWLAGLTQACAVRRNCLAGTDAGACSELAEREHRQPGQLDAAAHRDCGGRPTAWPASWPSQRPCRRWAVLCSSTR